MKCNQYAAVTDVHECRECGCMFDYAEQAGACCDESSNEIGDLSEIGEDEDCADVRNWYGVE